MVTIGNHFKTSYVDIKLGSDGIDGSNGDISKHHMLILNQFVGAVVLLVLTISKHHMLILNNEFHKILFPSFVFQNIIC